MSANHVVVPELRLVVSRLAGTLTPEDVERARDGLRGDPRFDPSYSHLVDMRRVTRLPVAAAGVRRLAGATTFAAGSRQALVASSDLVFGLARMYEGLAGALAQHVAVFRSLADALEWLGVAVGDLERHVDLDADPLDADGGLSPSR